MSNFNEWLGKMRPSINNYNYYVDFEKVYANVENIRIELNIMNSSLAQKTLRQILRLYLSGIQKY